MPLQINSLLNDRYEIRDLLGQGAMGSVYGARDTLRDMDCAVKELRLDKLTLEGAEDRTLAKRNAQLGEADDMAVGDACLDATNPRLVNLPRYGKIIEQFKASAKLLHQLTHPGLTPVLDYFANPDDARYYLVTERVYGEDLAKWQEVAPRGRIPEPDVLSWTDQVLDILAYCQDREIPVIHCDIKPANIVLDSNGRVFLVDFGIAQAARRGEGRSLGAGYTAHYSAPEQHEGYVDEKSDIYAVGATMYKLLTGSLPPPAPERACATPLTSPRQLVPGVSQIVSDVVMRALDLNPEKRFTNAAQMRAALPPIGRLRQCDTLVLDARVGSLAWSPSGLDVNMLAIGCSSATVRLWDMQTRRMVRSLSGSRGYVYTLQFSSCGQFLVSGSSAGSAQMWSVGTGKAVREVELGAGPLRGIAFATSDDDLWLACDEWKIVHWSPRMNEIVQQINPPKVPGYVMALTLAPTTGYLATGESSGSVRLWRTTDGSLAEELQGSEDPITGLAFSNGGELLAATSLGGQILCWDLKKRQLSYSSRRTPPAFAPTLSPDDRWLAFAWGSGSIHLLSAMTGLALPLTLEGHTDVVRALAFARAVAPDSPSRMALASGSDDGTVRIWWLE